MISYHIISLSRFLFFIWYNTPNMILAAQIWYRVKPFLSRIMSKFFLGEEDLYYPELPTRPVSSLLQANPALSRCLSWPWSYLYYLKQTQLWAGDCHHHDLIFFLIYTSKPSSEQVNVITIILSLHWSHPGLTLVSPDLTWSQLNSLWSHLILSWS